MAQSTIAPIPTGSGLADPGPLGLAAFAGTTFFLSVINTNMVSGTVTAGVLGLALFYGGITQLLAGMWEFAKGNTFGAVAFSSFGAFWMSYWYLVDHVLPGLSGAKVTDVNHAVGVYLLVWTIFTAYMAVAASRVSLVVLGVFVFLALTFLALTIGALDGTPLNGWTKLGGWLGLVTAVLAWYGSFAAVTNSTFKATVLPTFPR
jgi:succinate-acetate transporter protein